MSLQEKCISTREYILNTKEKHENKVRELILQHNREKKKPGRRAKCMTDATTRERNYPSNNNNTTNRERHRK
jgi:hypothetical protein